MNRYEFSQQISDKIEPLKEPFKEEFALHKQIRSCIIDDVLSKETAREIYDAFPKPEEMRVRRSLREYKYVAAQMNLYNPLLEEIIYAFQEPKILSLIGEITGILELFPDENLYAGGISLMSKGCFLNPHLDNSHDKDRNNYRVLNLLYYVTPEWEELGGGNLELWDNGVKHKPRTIWSKFNRLVIMITNKSSYHSVSPVLHNAHRCCVSNYYFSPSPVEAQDYFHVTSFRGRPEERMKDLWLRSDGYVRNGIRKIFPKGITKTFHIYNK